MTTTDADEPAVYRELPGFEKTHIDCETSAFSRMLRHRGLDPRVLGDEWGYRYRPGIAFPLWAIRPARGWPARVLRRWYGIELRVIDHDGPDAVWRHLRSVIARGDVAIVGVDLYEWPLSTFHQRFHFPHRVVIADCEPERALVLDGRGERRHVVWMSRGELSAAMSTEALSDPRHDSTEANRTIELVGGGEPAPGALRELTGARLRANLLDCFDPGTGGELRGETALATMLAALEEFLAASPVVEPKYVLPVVTFLGAMTSQWRLNGLFLDMATQRCGVDVTRDERTFRSLSREWMKVYQIFLFGFHAGRSPHAMLERLLARMRQMAQAESVALRALSDRLGVRLDGRANEVEPVGGDHFGTAYHDLQR